MDKGTLSTRWLIFRKGIEKFLIKNFKLFVPSSAGDPKTLGYHTFININKIFPLISKILSLTAENSLLTVNSFNKKFKNIENQKILMKLFNKYGSDKSKLHNYHLIYSSLFKNRGSVKKILEIGLGTNNQNLISNMGIYGQPGASVRAFRDFFYNAKIFGADIDKEILFKEDRIKTFHLDQTNFKQFSNLFKKIGKGFDIIIDDGLHVSYANLSVIIASLKFLKRDGYLIIEDIPFECRPIWEVVGSILNKSYNIYFIKTKLTYVFVVKNSKKNLLLNNFF